jgi:hypothetical protein
MPRVRVRSVRLLPSNGGRLVSTSAVGTAAVTPIHEHAEGVGIGIAGLGLWGCAR